MPMPPPNRDPYAMEISDELTKRVILCIIRVHQTLGPGFLEGVYHRAMLIELGKQGLATNTEKEVPIFYDGVQVGRHRLDILVEDRIILELKAAEALGKTQYAQVRSYLKATGLSIALLVNFNDHRADYRRIEGQKSVIPPIPISSSPISSQLSPPEEASNLRR